MNNFFERLNEWVRTSVTIRMLSVAFLILLLLIPASMIESLIREREMRQQDVIREISSKWSGPQTLTGPILSIPYDAYERANDGKMVKVTQWAHFLPESQAVTGQLAPQTRRRGLYEAVVYNAQLQFAGRFPSPDFSELGIAPDQVHWNDALVAVGISDMRGIEKEIQLQWAGQTYALNSGIETRDVLPGGASVKVRVAEGAGRYEYRFDLELKGSQSVFFVPVGRETNVTLQSDWPTPSFDGAFLPAERDVTETGFQAKWHVLHLNRQYPQQWKGSAYHLATEASPRYGIEPALQQSDQAAFGVHLLVPVDQYQKSMRTAKYAIMLIALTFVVFFFIEILTRRNIHPIQYILVGLALCVFYTLLLSLSEQIGFNAAYAVAALATIGLITAYVSSIFKNGRLTALMAGILTVLYGFIFVVLQLEDYALLLGSIALFVLLAVLMWLTRRIDWYQFGKKPPQEELA
ncbi:inner membrane protein [Catalinimonas alkaloidigena]|uniref:Inner membrane protein n=1 Tax=Catalinimonas alkaloidigena TaxID=1075417 RepID=A0A1G9PAH7_9BACT|nr:cell envelope integrity protein CreD [Catalinimonas alkaloidigena]SDL95758.1 inner membrane protein [Catalinimonas alkaloidigena]